MNFRYPLAANTVNKEDMKAWAEWILQDPPPRLTMGSLVDEYEKKWSRWIGRKFSKACSSGSTANELMAAVLLESEMLKNKKVIVPSAGWVTSVDQFIRLGFEPIMCEADPLNFGLEINHLKDLLEAHRPSIVFVVHVLGVPAHMNEIMELKDKYGFFLLEDACAAMGSSYHGRKVGTFGEMASVSTYYGHQFSTIEGGFVSTDNEDFDDLLMMLRSHGWIKGLSPEKRSRILNKYDIKDIGTDFVFVCCGYNFRLTDAQAFLGLRQLDRIDWLVEKRFKNHKLYKALLGSYLNYQRFEDNTVVCSIHFCALANSYEERNYITGEIQKNGIETRPFTSGNQGMHPYWFRNYLKFNCQTATKLYNCGFFLPNYPTLSEADIRHICAEVIHAVTNFRRSA